MLSALFGIKCPACGRRTRDAVPSPLGARMVCKNCWTTLKSAADREAEARTTRSARQIDTTRGVEEADASAKQSVNKTGAEAQPKRGRTNNSKRLPNKQEKPDNVRSRGNHETKIKELLHRAILDNNVNDVRFLLDRLRDKNAIITEYLSFTKNYKFEYLKHVTPLGLAVIWHKNVPVIRAILDAGVDVDATMDGKTALHLAAWGSRPEVVKLLLDHGAAPSMRDNDGSTPLHVILENSFGLYQEDTIEILLAYGSDLSILDNKGLTPLHIGARSEKIGCVKMLIAAGADSSLKDRDGKTPLDHAVEQAYGREFQYLDAQTKLELKYATAGERNAITEPILERLRQRLRPVFGVDKAPQATKHGANDAPEVSKIPMLKCIGCGKIYNVGDDAVAVSLEFGFGLARQAVILTDGKTVERQDLVAGLKDVSANRIEAARNDARNSWALIRASLSRGEPRNWCCEACKAVNVYPAEIIVAERTMPEQRLRIVRALKIKGELFNVPQKIRPVTREAATGAAIPPGRRSGGQAVMSVKVLAEKCLVEYQSRVLSLEKVPDNMEQDIALLLTLAKEFADKPVSESVELVEHMPSIGKSLVGRVLIDVLRGVS
jgi:ankyrin repeat protein